MINGDGTATTYTPNYSNSCGSRLPCGLCMITNSPCPMYNTWTPSITWQGPTCNTVTTSELKVEVEG